MTSIVFPGQGSQFLGMSKDFYDNFKSSRSVYEIISESTSLDIKKIIFENPSDLLNQTQFTQLAIYCASLSIFKVFSEHVGLKKEIITCMLGHSLGEYSALSASGIISIKDCSRLLKIRGELMQNSYEPNKSSMAAVIGINCDKVEKIIKDNNLQVEIANDNSPSQIVVSGEKTEILKSETVFKNLGAKRFVLLNVSAAFHSRFMIDAEKQMHDLILQTKFTKSSIAIISNFNAKMTREVDELINNLSNQMSNRVRWVESIKTLESTNENTIIEIGPGKVLSGLIKRISENFNIINIEKVSDLENIKYEF